MLEKLFGIASAAAETAGTAGAAAGAEGAAEGGNMIVALLTTFLPLVLKAGDRICTIGGI